MMTRVFPRIIFELRSLGGSFILFSLLSLAAVVAVAALGGELLDVETICFEVASPLVAAIAVGEWGQVKADGSRDIVAAQSRSLFSWVGMRFLTVFLAISIFACVGMAAACLLKSNLSFWGALAHYMPPALLFATACMLLNCLFVQEHTGTLVCCVLCIAALVSTSLLQLPFFELFYPFSGLVGDFSETGAANKAVLLALSLIGWLGIYAVCKTRRPVLET